MDVEQEKVASTVLSRQQTYDSVSWGSLRIFLIRCGLHAGDTKAGLFRECDG